MNQLTRLLVWLSRISHCRGFGIQSPTDYWRVRYVVNEHWPYYQYSETGRGDGWLRRKLGRLYFRLANWRQPQTIVSSDYHDYWRAGCRRAKVVSEMTGNVELLHGRRSAGQARRTRGRPLGHRGRGTMARQASLAAAQGRRAGKGDVRPLLLRSRADRQQTRETRLYH